MKRYVPDPAKVTNELAGRVDALERRTHELHVDVAALGRGLADLNGQIRHVTKPTTPSTTSSTNGTGSGSGGGGGGRGVRVPAPAGDPDDHGTASSSEDEEEEGQRDWLLVTDPVQARDWLVEADQFARTVLARHGLALADLACWALHPDTVTEVLALLAQRADAYANPSPTGVSEWLTRWLPAACDRIRDQIGPCRDNRAHTVDGRGYDATAVSLGHAALWWATARDHPAHLALRLSPTH